MRAPRFPLQLHAHYRPMGDARWHDATTRDISASGVLFEADDPPPVDARVEFRFGLAEHANGAARGEVAGHGQVVRLADGSHNAFAVLIVQYNIRHLKLAVE